MGSTFPKLSRRTWFFHLGLQMLLMVGAIFALFQAAMPLRAEKMEINYRNEGVLFAAGPDGVPPEKWERMKTTQLEIIEPMANWLTALSFGLLISSSASLVLLSRMTNVMDSTA